MHIIFILLTCVAMAVGSSLLWLISERVGGNQRPSLHVGNVVLVSIVGTVVYIVWGWKAPLWTLCIAGAWWILTELATRQSAKTPASERLTEEELDYRVYTSNAPSIITADKVAEYTRFNGDIDNWVRSKANLRKVLTEDEWSFLDSMVAEHSMIRKGLASPEAQAAHQASIKRRFDCKATYDTLSKYESKASNKGLHGTR